MRHVTRIATALLLVAGPVRAEGEIHETRPLAPDGSVQIENIAGSVRVIGWDRSEAEITGRLGRGTQELAIDADGDHLKIEVVLRSGRNVNAEGTDLELRVPRGIDLSVETISASIEVEGLAGEISLESVSGAASVDGDPREIQVESVSGAVKVSAGGSLQEASIETVSGAARLAAGFRPDGDYEIESVSGTIEVQVPAGLCAEFEVETFSGEIDSEVGPAPRRSDRHLPGESLRFSTCPGGGASFQMSSFSGRVVIRQR
jgi:hypothetical protein